MRTICLILAAILLGVVPAPNVDLAPYSYPHQLVDIGGRKLNLNCTGSGRTTVVLESGLPDSSGEWFVVQPRVAKFARVCSYDRAGLGFSDPGPMPRDASAIASDLHALLHAARIPGPYVLVGHSAGGLYVPVYAGRYPSEVAGMVLVDPSFPYQAKAFARVLPKSPNATSDSPDPQTLACQKAAHDGTIRKPSVQRKCEIDDAAVSVACKKSSAYLCMYWRYYFRWFQYARVWDVLVSEERSLDTRSSDEATRLKRNYGAMPLVVLTSDRKTWLRYGPQGALVWTVWNSAHDELAARSTVGVNYVVEGSSHNIECDRPNAVVSAVHEVVQQVESREAFGP